ncbi:MAG: EamA/RhaT family transporter [Ramlibacter sp.]|nr:EamA/RhaT family transporter [Ramlibacter sp.]
MLFATIILWGSNIPLLKWLTASFDPLLLGALRMAAASAALALLLRRQGNWAQLDRAQWRQLLLCGVLMVYLNQVLFVAGIARSTATNAALIMAMNPLSASFLALWFLREPLSGRRITGVLIGLGGVAVVILMRPGADLVHGGVGDLMMVGAILVFATGAMLVQRLAVRMDALTISFAIHAIGSAFLLLQCALQAAWQGQWPKAAGSPLAWTVLVLSGVISTALGNLLWNRSISIIGMARASVWIYWMPLFGIGLAVIFLGEPFTRWHLIGLLLVLAGTWLGSRRTRQEVAPVLPSIIE